MVLYDRWSLTAVLSPKTGATILSLPWLPEKADDSLILDVFQLDLQYDHILKYKHFL